MPVNNFKIEKAFQELIAQRESLREAKERLKDFPLKSEALTDLTRASRNIRDQINLEKERILKEFKDDIEYIDARDYELRCRTRMKEIISDLRELLADYPLPGGVAQFNVKLYTDLHSIGLEKDLRLFVDGKELK